jgi:tetratricopeptide (TPR) repeat protein
MERNGHSTGIIVRLSLALGAWLLLAPPGGAQPAVPQDDLLPPRESIAPGRVRLIERFAANPRAVLEALRVEAASGPVSAETAFWVGYFQLKLGETREAIRTLRGAQRSGGAPGVEKALGVAYYMERQYVLFRQQMERALAADPGDPTPLYYLGRHYDSEHQDFTRAAAYLGQFLERMPEHARARYYLGFSLEQQGRSEEAASEYRKAAELAGGAPQPFPEPWQGLARLAIKGGDADAALAAAERARDLAPDRADTYKLLGRIQEGQRQTEEAIQAWSRAAALDPADPVPHYRLYLLLRAGADPGKAAHHLAQYDKLRKIYGVE